MSGTRREAELLFKLPHGAVHWLLLWLHEPRGKLPQQPIVLRRKPAERARRANRGAQVNVRHTCVDEVGKDDDGV
jgi:hypothetical protein